MLDAARLLDVLVAGELYADLIMSGFDAWPQPGQEVFAREFHKDIGGGAAITSCGLAKLGAATGVLGVVGDDGEWLVQRLQNLGVDADRVKIVPGESTAFTVAVTTPADRSFFTYPGPNRHLPGHLAQAVRTGSLDRVRHVHLACAPNLDTAAELFAAIRRKGCTLSLDVGWHPAWLADSRTLPALSGLDLFFPNEAEARWITGETDERLALRRFESAGVRRVALKLGPRGAALLWDGQIHVEAPPHVTPVDTTGAGDCFDAGFLHPWLNRAGLDLCLRTANICGALSTEAHGGIAAFPSPAQVQSKLKVTPCEK